ncbi:MAG TPA: CPBP family intramembrane glutamic endopeptidase [Terracidiphilus sp.]
MEPEIPIEPTLPSTPTPGSEPPPPGPAGSMCLGFPVNDPANAGQSPEPERPYQGLKWVFVGPLGLRAGWSVLIFLALFLLIGNGLGFLLTRLHVIEKGGEFSARSQFSFELIAVVGMVLAASLVAVVERRSILDYNLRGPNRTRNFFSGLVVGFAALSTLVGSMAYGGWLHFGGVALHGSVALRYAVEWGAVFLLVGCFEEGTMRCYLQFTLTRGMNFWLAAGLIGAICAFLIFKGKGNGATGVYVIAGLGLVPAILLYVRKPKCAGFWYAAWFTSTLFGFGHTGNNGENWIGIFAAAFIGFVFCVSIWVTGSAWWAIGCHAAWDWAETYFYGTADSGMVAPGHLLSTSTSGKPLWSGGTDGPEGSVLIIPIVLLILVWLLVVYRRPRAVPMVVAAGEESLAS